ncbi:hypothetical protein Pmani_018180 [Petrolisthes manimaculis]|uniref:Uncharacterized protein n=1 Tax=Petrolisthes manimaculis TaxID=1843537 RepID=A0AAE1PKX2_9EUCA|nr:hypothetical protein Pmani_018180 [Petrolisthes manimaculis]
MLKKTLRCLSSSPVASQIDIVHSEGTKRELQSTVSWSREHYPHLHCPLSLCITLQWSRRDGHTINLPWSLLVKENTVLLGPGQKVPGRCRPLQGIGEVFNSPKSGTPLHATQHLLLETPYITNLSTLMAEALNRLVTVFNKQRHYLFTWAIETTDPLDDPFEDAELEALALSDLAVHCGITSSSLSLAVKPSPTTTANILHVLASVTVNGFGCSNK